MVSLRVPASTANLGPGFDCLGCAMALYLRCRFEARPAGVVEISGCPPAYRNEDNLIYRAYLQGLAHLGLPPAGAAIEIASDIPFSSGLGSSAAAAAAGLGAAFLLNGHELDRQAIFRLTTRMEGHPDNAAAAVLGGLRAAMQEGDSLYEAPFPLSDSLRWTALIPGFELPTNKARAALPSTLARQDAVYNLSHALLLLKALEAGDLQLLRAALKDRLHQRYRLPLIPDGEAIWQAAEASGAAVFLSGAGPTLMCIHQDEHFALAIAQHLPAGWQALPLQPDRTGMTQE
ncbi:MAG: homoserine kinase [Clostridiales bacterium]|nr:homoserine kinase [Clostridiales bacterium]